MTAADEPRVDDENEGIRLFLEIPSTAHGNLIVRYPYQRDKDYA